MSQDVFMWSIRQSRNLCDEYDAYIDPIRLYIPEHLDEEDVHILKAAKSMYLALVKLYDVGALNDGELGNDPDVMEAQKMAREALEYAEPD